MTGPASERRSSIEKMLSVVDVVVRVGVAILRLFGRRKRDKEIGKELP